MPVRIIIQGRLRMKERKIGREGEREGKEGKERLRKGGRMEDMRERKKEDRRKKGR